MPTQYPDLFAALAHPFEPYEIKERPGGNGRTLHYITARTAANRLDSVLGPENWSDRFYEVCNCLFCEITITLPDGSKVSKADAGGFKDMMEKGQIDQENTDKTGATDAFKRAAAKFGVARYLYRDGVPSYDGHPAPPPAQSNGNASNAQSVPRTPSSYERQQQTNGSPGPDFSDPSAIDLSRPGFWRTQKGEVKDRPGSKKGFYPWASKEVEPILEIPICDASSKWMRKNNIPNKADERTDEQHEALVAFCQEFVRERAGDSNQDAENHSQEPRPATKPHQQPPATGPLNIDESDPLKVEKRRIVTNVKSVVKASGEPVDAKHCLERINFFAWHECGEKKVDSLRECGDAMLIRDLDKVLSAEADAILDQVPF